MVEWILANWQAVLVAILTIDQVLIPIFPTVPFLTQLKNFLSGVVPPKA